MKAALILLSICISGGWGENEPLVEISNGWIQGTLDKSYKGRHFSSFEGIPYARPPIGDLRFEPPREPYNWTGTWIANTRVECIQFLGLDVTQTAIAGQEDCLYLNVYVPREQPTCSDNLNVIVHIHGGAFMMGSGHMYAGPKYLMDADMILVTMNYRLGPFGFLSTEDDVVPGNNGMKDQAASLRWIQKNIKYFGGNPNSITLTGMSAGGASVHLHYFSPLSKGLFHRGFSESGTALDPWALQERAFQKAQRLATLVGCPADASREIVSCLRTRSATEITRKIPQVSQVASTPLAAFAPVVEVENEEAFLTELPYKMLLDKTVTDVPWVDTVAEQEGYLFAIMWEPNLDKLLENFDKIAPSILEYMYTVDEADLDDVTEKIKQYYFSGSSNFDSLGKLMGDRLFAVGAYTAAKLQAKANKSPVYFYILGYKGEHGVGDVFGMNSEKIGASHGDGVLYYLNSQVSAAKLRTDDEKMKDIFLEGLTKYANNQEVKIPNVKWEPVKGGEALQYLYVKGPDHISMEKVKDFGSHTFWNQLPIKENEKLLKINAKNKDEL